MCLLNLGYFSIIITCEDILLSLSPKWSVIVESGFLKSFRPQTLVYVCIHPRGS